MASRRQRKNSSSSALKNRELLLALLLPILLTAGWAYGSQSRQELSGPAPCALIEDFSGAVQVMDSSRTRTIEVVKKAGVPCGGWISVGKGWARLHHRDGYELHASGNTFFQLPEGNPDGKKNADGLVLYKGEIYARVPAGSAPLHAITPNARVKTSDGQLILLYNYVDEETQLITLLGRARFENRFQSGREIPVAAGEASDLGFKQLRVVPSAPRAIVISSLKTKMESLKIAQNDQSQAVKKALQRGERKFASETEVAEANGQSTAEEPREAERSVASLEFANNVKGSKRRHAAAPQEDKEGEFLQAHFVQRLSAGENVGERVLFPQKYAGKPQRVKVEVEDPASHLSQEAQRNEEKEKRRLIEELSQIRLE